MRYRIVKLKKTHYIFSPFPPMNGYSPFYDYRIDEKFLCFWIDVEYAHSIDEAKEKIEQFVYDKKRLIRGNEVVYEVSA
jgi:hypothetical protein